MKLNAETKKKMLALKNLGLTDEEVIKVIEDDEKIDKGEKLFELAETEKGNSRKARQVARIPKPQTNREKKEDADKKFLIETFELALDGFAEKVNIANPEREITFFYKDRKFKIVLSCPRS